MISTSQTSHLDSIDSFLAMEVFAKAQALEAQGRDIIHLEFGEPDFTAPPAAAESVKKSMEINDAGYTFSQGLEELRIEIAKKYANDYGVKILPEQVLVSMGHRFCSIWQFEYLLHPEAKSFSLILVMPVTKM